jgi:hypothetical protein
MSRFEDVFQKWMDQHSARRRELLRSGLSRGSVDFLRWIWFPAIGNMDYLHPEYEVRDYNNGYRYLDFSYMPGNAKGCIEVQDYRSHARDIEASRFKDLCMKHSLLALDDWIILPIAYLSIRMTPVSASSWFFPLSASFWQTRCHQTSNGRRRKRCGLPAGCCGRLLRPSCPTIYLFQSIAPELLFAN